MRISARDLERLPKRGIVAPAKRKSSAKSAAHVALMAQIRHAGITGAVEEHRFHPSRRWRFDIAFPSRKFAIEIEGGVWTGGRHTRGSGFVADCEKYAEALMLGWTVLRVPTGWARDGKALGYVVTWMERDGARQ